MLLALLLAASERLPLFVTYDAPRECPPAQRFEAELQIRTSKVELAPDAETKLTIVIKKVKGKFVGTSSLHGEREFKGGKCESVVGALSLATALLLDPEGARTGPVTPQEIAAVPPPPEPEPVPLVVELDPMVTESSPPPPAPIVLEEVVTISAPPASPWSVTVLAGGGISTAVSGLEPGVQLSVGVRRSVVAAQVTPLFLFGRRVSSANGDASYRGFGARLDLAAAFDVSIVELAIGAQLTALFLPITSPDAEVPRSANSSLFAPGPVAHATLKLGAWRVALDGGAGFHLKRESYVVTNAGTVFTVPAVFAFVGLSLGRTFS